MASALNEIAHASNIGIVLDEGSLPVRPAVQAACEMLGFDPLYVANEGKLLAAVDPAEADRILEAMRAHPYGEGAVIIGQVTGENPGRVLLKTVIGPTRLVDVLMGEMLPRIC